METVALRAEAEARLASLPDEKLPQLISFIKTMDDELTLDGKTLDDLTPEWREALELDDDLSVLSRPFKTVEETMAALLSEGEDEFPS